MCQNCNEFVNNWKQLNKGKKPADECHCKDRDIEDIIHIGNFKELFEFCNNCGGVV